MSVADLLPEPLLDDEGMGQIALTLDAELARLDLRAPDLLGRLGTLSRPFLDAVARSFGVAFYPASISDDAVRDVIAGAVAWHRRRGTRWALAWALDVAGLGHAEVLEARDIAALPGGVRRLDENPPWSLGEDPPVMLSRTALDTDLPLNLSWAEFVVRLDLDDPATIAGWGPALERAVTLSSPASCHARFVLTYADDDAYRRAGALYEARRTLGPGYTYSTLPTLGGVPLDGSWTLGASAVHARPLDPSTVVERIVPDTAVYSALDNRDGTALLSGPVTTETYTVTYRGVEYERTRARLVSYEGAALLARPAPGTLAVPTTPET
ncbi:MAG: hypothetical protein CMM84_03620 [Rhodothermaceae bacterium]|nr:hypothetical protein [Rhodothermaceae bacterium]MBC15306.1 hypothetical protein [Rhodothermaceae bacterium]